MAKSKFKLSSTFQPNMRRLAEGMQDAAEVAMGRAMERAEQDAQQMYRWRTPGEYEDTDVGGNIWTWTVTGSSAASITGYVVGNKQLKNLPSQATTVTKNGQPFAPHSHGTDA